MQALIEKMPNPSLSCESNENIFVIQVNFTGFSHNRERYRAFYSVL